MNKIDERTTYSLILKQSIQGVITYSSYLWCLDYNFVQTRYTNIKIFGSKGKNFCCKHAVRKFYSNEPWHAKMEHGAQTQKLDSFAGGTRFIGSVAGTSNFDWSLAVFSCSDRRSINSFSKRWTFLFEAIAGRISSLRSLCFFIPCRCPDELKILEDLQQKCVFRRLITKYGIKRRV